MKKRMLITTIVMVLVVAIALTTSSLAWFTMSAQVEITEVSFGAVKTSGADLKVSGLARTNWSTSASLGSGATFAPVQGEPIVSTGEGTAYSGDGNMILTNYGPGAVSFKSGTWFAADDVTTTPVGSETANQKVVLKDVSLTGPYFYGGFNVRNDGTAATASADVTISGALKVGTPRLINPTGSNNDGDEYYAYGAAPDAATLPALGLEKVNDYEYSGGTDKAAVIAAFVATDSDKALAGGLRVAVFTRTWTYDTSTTSYTNAAATRDKIYAFSTYNVAWSPVLGAWTVGTGGGNNNDLYVIVPDVTPVGDVYPVYSKNLNLATGTGTTPNATYQVIGSNANVSSIDLTNSTDNNLTDVTIEDLAPITDGVYSGVEFFVIVWLDGWDDETLPIAGGGSVSLAYAVTSSTSTPAG